MTATGKMNAQTHKRKYAKINYMKYNIYNILVLLYYNGLMFSSWEFIFWDADCISIIKSFENIWNCMVIYFLQNLKNNNRKLAIIDEKNNQILAVGLEIKEDHRQILKNQEKLFQQNEQILARLSKYRLLIFTVTRFWTKTYHKMFVSSKISIQINLQYTYM